MILGLHWIATTLSVWPLNRRSRQWVCLTPTQQIMALNSTFLGAKRGSSGGSDSKESAYRARDLGLIPRSGRSPGEGNCYPLQYSWLENSMDRGAWRATVYGVEKESNTTEQLTLCVCVCVCRGKKRLRNEHCIFSLAALILSQSSWEGGQKFTLSSSGKINLLS